MNGIDETKGTRVSGTGQVTKCRFIIKTELILSIYSHSFRYIDIKSHLVSLIHDSAPS